jgi:hypothetical protein
MLPFDEHPRGNEGAKAILVLPALGIITRRLHRPLVGRRGMSRSVRCLCRISGFCLSSLRWGRNPLPPVMGAGSTPVFRLDELPAALVRFAFDRSSGPKLVTFVLALGTAAVGTYKWSHPVGSETSGTKCPGISAIPPESLNDRLGPARGPAVRLHMHGDQERGQFQKRLVDVRAERGQRVKPFLRTRRA